MTVANIELSGRMFTVEYEYNEEDDRIMLESVVVHLGAMEFDGMETFSRMVSKHDYTLLKDIAVCE